MSTNPPPMSAPCDSKEAHPIDDSSMVFRSAKASVPSSEAKKLGLKMTKAKLKMRKGTPAPPLKQNGRKRPVLYPFPEDKQLRKRIDFGDDNRMPPRGKASLFQAIDSAPSTHGGSEGSHTPQELMVDEDNIVENYELALVCFNPISVGVASPESVEAAGDEEDAGSAMDHSLRHLRSKSDANASSNVGLGGEIGNFPNLNQETSSLLKSSLDTCHVEVAHGDKAVGAVGEHNQPKSDNLLLRAQLDTAEKLDMAAAQPLLAGSQPEKTHLTIVHEPEPLSSVLPLRAPDLCPDDTDVEMTSQGGLVPEGLG